MKSILILFVSVLFAAGCHSAAAPAAPASVSSEISAADFRSMPPDKRVEYVRSHPQFAHSMALPH